MYRLFLSNLLGKKSPTPPGKFWYWCHSVLQVFFWKAASQEKKNFDWQHQGQAALANCCLNGRPLKTLNELHIHRRGPRCQFLSRSPAEVWTSRSVGRQRTVRGADHNTAGVSAACTFGVQLASVTEQLGGASACTPSGIWCRPFWARVFQNNSEVQIACAHRSSCSLMRRKLDERPAVDETWWDCKSAGIYVGFVLCLLPVNTCNSQ